MSFLLLGGSGHVGRGFASLLLARGETVIVQTRSRDGEAAMRAALQAAGAPLERLSFVVGGFESSHDAAEIASLVRDRGVRHVADLATHVEALPGTLFETQPEAIHAYLARGFDGHVRAFHALVPLLRDVEGSSFTMMTGGLAHGVYVPPLWAVTMKNAFLSTMGMILGAELQGAKLRFNTLCLHYSVTFRSEKNAVGMPAKEDAADFAQILDAIARGKVRGETICVASPDATKKWVAEHK